nr:protein ROOT PRIMORDIUM DEFECTIVE 1 [Ipomoea batatas]GMD78102.1 protein ROOT PRIMORDIUM DEFECTIVE 1 [Ipomoea batatas]GMD78104.1 protein ROOT PRIMORDIUM DEFECTIVE 1 [Ipomoea batatas]
MHFISRSLPNSVRRCHHQQRRALYDGSSSIRCVRDRGLDHAVERERSLKQVWNIKNLIKSEPSKSLPLNLITQSKDSLEIPTRPIEFLRKYPAIFQEFFPGSVNIHPHIKLTHEALTLDSEEQLLHDSVSYRENIADRLLKLLMIGKTNKIPLSVLDRLKWDLGLPQDYAKMIVPEFPDYFRVSNGGDAAMLELVCWSHELAVSEMEKKSLKGESEGSTLRRPSPWSILGEALRSDDGDCLNWLTGELLCVWVELLKPLSILQWDYYWRKECSRNEVAKSGSSPAITAYCDILKRKEGYYLDCRSREWSSKQFGGEKNEDTANMVWVAVGQLFGGIAAAHYSFIPLY